MKIGLIGPANGDVKLLSEAIEFLIAEADVDQAMYLGQDDAIDAAVASWGKAIMGGDGNADAFVARAIQVAHDGSAEEIDKLLEDHDALLRLRRIRKLPPGGARAVEMIEDRIITVVFDKNSLQEEDIANASLLVYGKSSEALLKRFGPRYFFTPGPLAARAVAIIEAEGEGQISLAVYDPSGTPLWREVLSARSQARMMVSP